MWHEIYFKLNYIVYVLVRKYLDKKKQNLRKKEFCFCEYNAIIVL